MLLNQERSIADVEANANNLDGQLPITLYDGLWLLNGSDLYATVVEKACQFMQLLLPQHQYGR